MLRYPLFTAVSLSAAFFESRGTSKVKEPSPAVCTALQDTPVSGDESCTSAPSTGVCVWQSMTRP